jgi:eukaryotic-like serine/threonine-protein kinase
MHIRISGSIFVLNSTELEGAASVGRPPTLRVGEVVAEKYTIERLLGSGGMAEVYAAVNGSTEKRVALKWIRPALASTAEGLARFRREALAVGRISHPNVVTIFDVVQYHGSACLVMELLEGETLARRMARTGPLPFVEAVALILPAMRGVAAAHAQGVVHRDLKPDNIFICLDPDGLVRDCKVLDFGVSKLSAPDSGALSRITISGNLVGTPAYMAPEQVRGSNLVDRRADVYSLGVVLYEMLAGRPPFLGTHFSDVMLQIVNDDPPPLARFRPDTPRGLAQVVHRSLDRSTEARFPDMPSFMRALEEVARDELHLPVGTPPEGLITQMALRSTPHGRGLTAVRTRRNRSLLIVAAVMLAAAGAAVWWRDSVTPAAPRAGAETATRARDEVPAKAATAAGEPRAPAPSTLPPAPPPAPAVEAAAATRPAGEAPPPGRAASTRTRPRRGDGPARAERGPAAAAPVPPDPHPRRAGKLTVDDF